jgi:hypothetical protein
MRTALGIMILILALAPAPAVARAKQRATQHSKTGAFLLPTRYHKNAHGRQLVGLDWRGRVKRAVRQRPDGRQVRALYGNLLIYGRAHPLKHSVVIQPDGQTAHRVVIKGFSPAEVRRLRAGGLDEASSIRGGTLVRTWKERGRRPRRLTDLEGGARVVAGSLPFKVGAGTLVVSLIGAGLGAAMGASLSEMSAAEGAKLLISTASGKVQAFGLGGGYGVLGQLGHAAPHNVEMKTPRPLTLEIPSP